MAAVPEPPRQDVLRPLVAKGDENGGNGDGIVPPVPTTAFLYQQNPLVEPALLQYTLAMRPYLPYALSQYALNNFHQQLLHGATGKNPVAALPVPPLLKENGEIGDKGGSGDEKENKEDVEEDQREDPEPGEKMEKVADIVTEKISETDIDDKAPSDEDIEKQKEETIKKVLEMVEATATSQQQTKLNTLATISSEQLQQMQQQCRYCPAVFGSPIELHQHERYLCPQNQQDATSTGDAHSDDGSLTQGCRVRSILSDEQKRHLEAQYAATPWPAKHDMERLAGETGLARRVIQVWFQNCRARDRRKGKSIPERPVGLRTPPESYSRPTVPEPSRPYIPRVPQITRSFFVPPTPTPTTTGIQIEPLDLSNKPGQATNQALNLSTKAPTPPPLLFPFQPETPQIEVNTTPAHSTPRTTPERPPATTPTQMAPSPVAPAQQALPLTPQITSIASVSPPPPRTSTPVMQRSSPAVFPTMIPSPTPPPALSSAPSDVIEEMATLSSMESSFGSLADDRNERKRSWRQVRSILFNLLMVQTSVYS